jgi:23S rRNA (cytidine1920-2'-O)/16S rRNA (cytidine1409-2'-O)-methyltransferase
MHKIRLDLLMVERGLVDSRAQAQRLVMAGQVRVGGQVAIKSSVLVMPEVELEIDRGPLYVSRGGEKLAEALKTFPIRVAGKICADVGASTGGFTDCLLQNGAQRVYAIDVGQGILHWKLRQDERVVVMEGTNARYIESLPERVDLVTIDASFISLKVLLPVVRNWLSQREFEINRQASAKQGEPIQGQVITLIKPQFEAGRNQAARGKGVIRDPEIHRQILSEVLFRTEEIGYSLAGLIRSPLLGPKGNAEFLAWLIYPASGPADLARIKSVILTCCV